MKWCNAALSFLLVTSGVFFIAGWCTLPAPRFPPRETSRLDRLQAISKMDWRRNTWGFALAPALGVFSGWLTFRRGNRNSA